MRHSQEASSKGFHAGDKRPEAAMKAATGPNLSAHYKPVGIQAITAATVCKEPPKPAKAKGPDPEDS